MICDGFRYAYVFPIMLETIGTLGTQMRYSIRNTLSITSQTCAFEQPV